MSALFMGRNKQSIARQPDGTDASRTIIAELEDAIRGSSPEKRTDTLRRATDLFLSEAERLTEAQIAVFDQVLVHLIKKIETKAKVELSRRLAPAAKAPVELIRQLARDDEITVAEPVLSQSPRLTNDDLVEIANCKSQQHLLAISGRGTLDEPVTEVLANRGDNAVKYKLAANTGARFSETGFAALIDGAADYGLIEQIGQRIDLPPRLLRQLLSKATAAVRARLLAAAPPETRDVIRHLLSDIAGEVYREIAPPRDFSRALATINTLRQQGGLNEASLLEFARTHSYEETVAALGALCSTSVELLEPLITSTNGLLVVCKAARLDWATAKALLEDWPSRPLMREVEVLRAEQDYSKLSEASAQRTLGFWKARIEVA